MDPRAEEILPRALGTPTLRPRRHTSILWGRGGQTRPTAHGLGGGGLRGSPGTGGGGMRPPGHLLSQGCLCDAANHRFPAHWTREEDAFAQPWDYATAGPLWGNPPFSRPEEVVAKAAREGSLMLIVAPEWLGPKYPWWTTLCALCPRRWQLPHDWPIHLRGGTT